jgi:tetratricopeptide (TPR) repeat protein
MKKPTNTETNIMLEQAWKKFDKRQFDAAEDIFSAILDNDNSNVEALHGMAGCLLRKKDAPAALKLYNQLEKLDGENAKTFHLRALAYGAGNKHEKAVEDLEKAIELTDDGFEAYLDLGGTFIVKKDYKRAAQCFEKCINLDGKCSEAWIGKALLAHINKEQKAAIEFINIALKLNPKSLLALLIKTELLLDMGKKADVEKEVKKIMAIDPNIFKSATNDDDELDEDDEDDLDDDDDYEKDEDAYRTEDDEIEEFDLDD